MDGPLTHLEVRAAGGQDHFVGLQLVAFGRQSDVDEVLIVEQRRKDGYKVGLVVVPAQAKLLHRHGVANAAGRRCWPIKRAVSCSSSATVVSSP